MDCILKERKICRALRKVAAGMVGKGLARVVLAVCLFSWLLPEVNCMASPRRKREDNCPKLEFLSSHGCRPCSLCDPGKPHVDWRLIRKACQDKHPDSIPHHGPQKLWCDSAAGPFPECPPIPEVVIKNCSGECRRNKRRFAAPGCVCDVGCHGDQARRVECTRDLQWSDKASIPLQCLPPSTTTTTTETPEGECPPIPEAVIKNCSGECRRNKRRFAAPGCVCDVGCHGDQARRVECTRDLQWSDKASIPLQCLPPSTTTTTTTEMLEGDTDQLYQWLWVLVGVFGGVVLGCAISVLIYLWRKRRYQPSSSSPPSSSQSSTTGSEGSSSSSKTEDPLLGPEKTEKGLTTVCLSVSSLSDGHALSQPSGVGSTGGALVDSQVVWERSGPVASDMQTVPETQALLGRGLGSGGGDASKRKTASQGALQALLNSRGEMLEMSRMFDQEDRFDRVTWHNVATELAGWDSKEVNSKSYMLRPNTSQCPGDGFIYQVLTHMYEETSLGLLDLLRYLQTRLHVNYPEAEDFLTAFWEHWKQENAASETEAPC